MLHVITLFAIASAIALSIYLAYVPYEEEYQYLAFILVILVPVIILAIGACTIPYAPVPLATVALLIVVVVVVAVVVVVGVVAVGICRSTSTVPGQMANPFAIIAPRWARTFMMVITLGT
nr:hypothetical protein [Tanacetum cinerariifolium]